MQNMKDLSLRVNKLWTMLSFLTDRQTEGQTDRVITIGHPPSGGALNMKALSLLVRPKKNICLFPVTG